MGSLAACMDYFQGIAQTDSWAQSVLTKPNHICAQNRCLRCWGVQQGTWQHRNYCLSAAHLGLQGLAEELAEDGDGGGHLVVYGRQAAGLQGRHSARYRGQIPHHHEAQHQAHTNLHMEYLIYKYMPYGSMQVI